MGQTEGRIAVSLNAPAPYGVRHNNEQADTVASLPALGPWATAAERGPSLESIYRVSLTADLCEGNKVISFKNLFHRSQLRAPRKEKNPGALGTCPVCPLVKTALSGRRVDVGGRALIANNLESSLCSFLRLEPLHHRRVARQRLARLAARERRRCAVTVDDVVSRRRRRRRRVVVVVLKIHLLYLGKS